MSENRLVDFLVSYGPHASGSSVYDELVVKAAAAAGCDPLDIEQPVINEVVDKVKSDAPCCIILTGTAGDGKTYTARKAFEEIGGREEDWINVKGILEYNYNEQKIEFIKDLSEIGKKDKGDLLPRIHASIHGKGDTTFVICSNYGHLLGFLGDEKKSSNGAMLYKMLKEMHRYGSKDYPDKHLLFINMSRRTDAIVLDNIIDAIANHKDWKKCKKCIYYRHKKNPCPIRVNLDILQDGEKSNVRKRIKNMIDIASASGKHMPTRQLIMLAVNIILGDRKDRDKAGHPSLLNCARAKQRADEMEYSYTNPYANVFGENINKKQRYTYGIYSALKEFGVGYEANNEIDQKIISGYRELPDDNIYGMSIFKSQRRDYRASKDKDVEAYCDAVVDQRRRLFFSSNESLRGDQTNPWELSVFSQGDLYCSLLEEKGDTDEVSDKVRKIRRKIICGLNRIMTGLMTNTNDKLWIIEPKNDHMSGWEMPIVIKFAGKGYGGDARLCFKSPSIFGAAPQVVVTMPHCGKAAGFILRPPLFEYILRVSNGAIPSTFSLDCRMEISRFQLAINGLLEIDQQEGGVVDPQIVSMENGDLKGSPIHFFESKGDW